MPKNHRFSGKNTTFSKKIPLTTRIWASMRRLIPQICPLCQTPTSARAPLCAPCHASLPWMPPCCDCCGHWHCRGLCAQGLRVHRGLQPQWRSAAIFSYQPPLRNWVVGSKFEDSRVASWVLASLLGEYMAQHIPSEQVIVPIPTHFHRLSARGIDHVRWLCQHAAAGSGLAQRFAPDFLLRQRNTRAQVGLSMAERQRNVRGAFIAQPACRDQRIVLIDDVYTSGATSHAATIALLDAGAAQVQRLSLCRVLKHAAPLRSQGLIAHPMPTATPRL